jgi:quinol monooxygenase YgiN
MGKFAVIARIPLQEGAKDDFVTAFGRAIANAEAEDGTLQYVLHADAEDPDLMWVYELYADRAALDAHLRSEAMRSLLPTLGPYIAGRADIRVVEPLTGKGL